MIVSACSITQYGSTVHTVLYGSTVYIREAENGHHVSCSRFSFLVRVSRPPHPFTFAFPIHGSRLSTHIRENYIASFLDLHRALTENWLTLTPRKTERGRLVRDLCHGKRHTVHLSLSVRLYCKLPHFKHSIKIIVRAACHTFHV